MSYINKDYTGHGDYTSPSSSSRSVSPASVGSLSSSSSRSGSPSSISSAVVKLTVTIAKSKITKSDTPKLKADCKIACSKEKEKEPSPKERVKLIQGALSVKSDLDERRATIALQFEKLKKEDPDRAYRLAMAYYMKSHGGGMKFPENLLGKDLFLDARLMNTAIAMLKNADSDYIESLGASTFTIENEFATRYVFSMDLGSNTYSVTKK